MTPSTMPPTAPPRSRTLLGCVIVALAYYASGRLGLLLAIPPGYATAVWPPSGIALAAILLGGWRLWPGIWCGSFLINVWTGLDTGSLAGALWSLAVPAAIASGAALQACAGARLIRRLVGYSNLLVQEVEVVWILFLGGPVSCLLNASIGASALYLHGSLPADNLLFTWWTWWVGDTIGVLVFAPLVLLWSVRPYAQWLRRQVFTTLPLALVFALVVGLFVFVSAREEARLQDTFAAWTEEFAGAVRADVDDDLDALYSIESFFSSSDRVTRPDFDSFTTRLLAHLKGVQGMSWVAPVSDAQRAAVEQEMRADGEPGFEIREQDAAGNLLRAAPRPRYAPVTYMVPMAGNERAVGFDIESESVRREALHRARDGGAPAATGRINLVQDPQKLPGLLVFLPVYERGAPHDTPAERQAALHGYAAAVFRVEDMLRVAVARAAAHGLEVRVVDRTRASPPLLLWGAEAETAPGARDLVAVLPIDVAGRAWEAELRLPGSYLEAHRSWQTWTLLAGGMLFTGLLGIFLLVIAGRGARIESLVEARTAELQRVNRELTRAVTRSGQLELDSRKRAEELAAINKELEQFNYVVSHDLQAPLRNIDSFSALIERRYAAPLAGEGLEFIGFIRSCAADMRRLIEDLLQLSRVNARSAEMAPVATADALRAAVDLLRSDIAAAGARIDEGRLPAVHGDQRLLTQLFQNLVANAIKFRRPGVAPVVSVGAEAVAGEWLFRVADNGIGIAEADLPKLFQVFKRLHAAEQYPGTGIGLALCRKIVQLHGGQIWVESQSGVGTTFLFTMPIRA
jgi:signal transduction histidine kinase/integral membrane sensor domain MASE1